MKPKRYINQCPIGCESKTIKTEITTEQGVLEKCDFCHQFFSQCSTDEFNRSMMEFNVKNGTWPPPENLPNLERSTLKTLKKIEHLMKLKMGDIKLLDVGCSNGAFIASAKKTGVMCEGVEPAEEAAKAAIKAGLKVHAGYLEQIGLSEKSFDVISLFEVIEHLKDPVSLLTECNRLLKDDGIMVIRTANTDSWTVRLIKGKWHYFDINKHGGHVSFFCRHSMKELATKTGFDMVRFDTHSVTFKQKHSSSKLGYRSAKIFTEILNLPAKLSGNGQEMEVYLKKKSLTPN